jgi:hypothetical protein
MGTHPGIHHFAMGRESLGISILSSVQIRPTKIASWSGNAHNSANAAAASAGPIGYLLPALQPLYSFTPKSARATWPRPQGSPPWMTGA